MDLSVILVSFNTRARLDRTLAALFAGVGELRVEVVVVDNASGDGSAAMVRAKYPQVRLIANDANRFYTAANNQGLAVASGRYLLVLNPDAEPGPGTLPALVAALDARPDVGLASCRLVWDDGRVQANCARDWTWAALLAEHTLPGLLVGRLTGEPWRHHRTYAGWTRESERDVDVLPGSVLCARREVVEAVGGFDERLRLYFGEDEWCARVRAAGYAVRYLPLGRVTHAEGASAASVPDVARRLFFDDMRRFAAIRFGGVRAGTLAALLWPTRLALWARSRWRR